MTISAKVIAYSRFKRKRIITLELEYPRFCHSELLTHRVFSRNAASSRAIPVSAMLEQVRNNPAMPIHWGLNEPGMQAKATLNSTLTASAKYLWCKAAKMAASIAEALNSIGLHKQTANRILEPFQTMKTVVTSTEWENFFWLRNHPDAQPEIQELARLALEAIEAATPVELKVGDWHTPYYGDGFWRGNEHKTRVLGCPVLDNYGFTLKDALAISSSCCAQVSFRKLDDSLDKAKRIYARLVESEPVHASPFEHQATPIAPETSRVCNDYGNGERYYFGKSLNNLEPETWQDGVTHVDREGNFWSGNLCGFIQHRQLIPNNAKRG